MGVGSRHLLIFYLGLSERLGVLLASAVGKQADYCMEDLHPQPLSASILHKQVLQIT